MRGLRPSCIAKDEWTDMQGKELDEHIGSSLDKCKFIVPRHLYRDMLKLQRENYNGRKDTRTKADRRIRST